MTNTLIAYIIISETKTETPTGRRENTMTYRETKNEIKKLVIEKGLNNIYNRDLNEIHHRTGASYSDMDNALNYFRFSPQTAKYRTK